MFAMISETCPAYLPVLIGFCQLDTNQINPFHPNLLLVMLWCACCVCVFKFTFTFKYIYVHVSVCRCVHVSAGVWGDQKKVSDLLELELQTVVSYLM